MSDQIKSKPWCCYIGEASGVQCGNDPEWEVWSGPHPDDSTQSCTRHVGEMLTDAPEHKIYRIEATTNPADGGRGGVMRRKPDEQLKQESPYQAFEESGTGFDPTAQVLDLSKEEKRRTTALFMAINAYHELIIKEAAYLREAADLARRDEGPKLQPATIDAIVIAALKFDAFIAGGVSIRDNTDSGNTASAVESGVSE